MAKKKKKTAKKKKVVKYVPLVPQGTTVHDLMSLKGFVLMDEIIARKDPSKFKAEFIQMIETHMAIGGTLSEFAKKVGCHRNTLEKWLNDMRYRALKDAAGKGALEFIITLPLKLREHMEQGRSFESFGAVCNRSRDFLYNLTKVYPDFKEAKEGGTVKSMYLWETLLQAQASGKLIRMGREEPVLDKDGNPVYDADGQAVTKKFYVPSLGSSRALIFAMTCRFEEYRNVKDDTTQSNQDELRRIMDANVRDKK